MSTDLIIHGSRKDLGGFSVYRSLPTAQKRSVGPFVFFDHMGPMVIDETHMLDVRPHPHIGLATVTFLYEGKGYHRDSLGSDQIIKPGDVNLMIAGRGIVHSERTPEEEKKFFHQKSIHGLQIWVALPQSFEDCAPEFHHYSRESIPQLVLSEAVSGNLLIGTFLKAASPVKTLSRTLFMTLLFKAQSQHRFSFEEEEIGVFIVSGSATVNGSLAQAQDLVVVSDVQNVEIQVSEDTCVAVIGGSVLPEPRHIWWNFVSSDKEKIRVAAEKWKNQEMGQVRGETDFIPLPDYRLP